MISDRSKDLLVAQQALRRTHRHGNGVGHIRRLGWLIEPATRGDRKLHAALVGSSVPGEGLLHFGWGVFDDFHVVTRRRQENHASSMAEPDAGGGPFRVREELKKL